MWLILLRIKVSKVCKNIQKVTARYSAILPGPKFMVTQHGNKFQEDFCFYIGTSINCRLFVLNRVHVYMYKSGSAEVFCAFSCFTSLVMGSFKFIVF